MNTAENSHPRSLRGGPTLLVTLRVDVKRPRFTIHDFRTNDDLLDAFKAWQIEHRVEQDAFHDRPQSARAGPPLDRLFGDDIERLVLEGEFGILHLEEALILLDERVLRLGQDLLQRILVKVFERRDDRQTADEFGDEPEFEQILRLDLAQDLAGAAIIRRLHLGGKTDRRALAAARDNLFQPSESAAANEEDVRRVDLQEFLLGMLAPALRRHRRDSTLHDFQERLLDALARYVAGDRGVVGFARNLVDLVDID